MVNPRSYMFIHFSPQVSNFYGVTIPSLGMFRASQAPARRRLHTWSMPQIHAPHEGDSVPRVATSLAGSRGFNGVEKRGKLSIMGYR